MFYTSNEREYLSLYSDIFDSENKHKSKKIYMEMYFFYFYFSIVHISLNNVFGSLKFCMHVDNISVKGFSFYVKKKKRVTFYLFLLIFFLDFLKKQTRAYIKILRHSSLDSNVVNMYVRFQGCNLYNQRDIHGQKIKVKKLIFFSGSLT